MRHILSITAGKTKPKLRNVQLQVKSLFQHTAELLKGRWDGWLKRCSIKIRWCKKSENWLVFLKLAAADPQFFLDRFLSKILKRKFWATSE